MKKALSVLLAIMMLFGALSVGASAESSIATDKWHGPNGPATAEQVVLYFNLNSGTLTGPERVWNEETGEFSTQTNIKGTYVMVPLNKEDMKPGSKVKLPYPNPPTDYKFDYWECETYGGDYPGNGEYIIPAGSAGTTIRFLAGYSHTIIEEDSGTKVIGILVKVFGAILGLLLYAGDTAKGVAFMEKILGGIMG